VTSSLIVGDLHRSDNPRDAYRHDFQPWLLKKVKELRPDRVIFLGDITTAKDRHPAWLVNEIVDDFAKLADETDLIVNKGNHDYRDAEHPFFRFLSHIEGIRWINSPKMIDGWLFLPHTYDWKNDWKDLDFRKPELIIAHNTFEGAESESGRRLSGIPTNIFPKDLQVIAGDVHKPQHRNVLYVGAPYTINFGDDYEPRLLLIEESASRIEYVESVPVPGVQKRLVEFTAVEKNKKSGKWKMDIPKEYDDLLIPGDILKVRVHLEMRHVPEWQAIRSAIREALGTTFTVDAVIPIVAKDRGKRSKSKDHVQHSDPEYLKLYATSRALDADTLKAGINLIK
jgi:predicted phosphodiesterase